jgi:DNA-binding response OmpR family regulator
MRLLVVEDEKRMAGLLKKALQEEGYAVTTAADGKTAVEIAQASQFDLILLDIMLPVWMDFRWRSDCGARAIACLFLC